MTMQGTEAEHAVVGSAVATPRRLRRTLVILAGLMILLLVVAGVGVAALTSLGNGVDRIPGAFVPLDPAERPVATEATTFLVMGTDSRSAEATGGTEIPMQAGFGAGRADAIMLVTVQPDRTTGSVISIPRDSWVDVPGHGMNKINAAYAFGGPSLLIETVEALTGVRVDHFGVVDFAGFRSLVDAVGGIDVQVAAATSDLGVQFRAGNNHLDGLQAIAYVHQRYGLPGGDIDRGKRQQNAIRALLTALQAKASTDPGALLEFARHAGDAVSVDDGLSNTGLAALAVEYRDLRSSGVAFLTAPVSGLGTERGGQSVVYLDEGKARDLWGSVRNGSVGQYANLNPSETLADTPS